MATKAQHEPGYLPLPDFLKEMRETAGMTQRDIGQKLDKPQSWVHNCETGNRRVDVGEFARWAVACGVDPGEAFGKYLEVAPISPAGSRKPRRPKV